MKLFRSIALGFGLLLATGSAFAQQTHVKANIPFAFTIDGKSLPAGEYTVDSLALDGVSLAIRSRENKVARLVLSSSYSRGVNPFPKTALVFHRVNGQYFLSEVMVEGQKVGRQLRTSDAEIQLAKTQPQENVIIAAELSR